MVKTAGAHGDKHWWIFFTCKVGVSLETSLLNKSTFFPPRFPPRVFEASVNVCHRTRVFFTSTVFFTTPVFFTTLVFFTTPCFFHHPCFFSPPLVLFFTTPTPFFTTKFFTSDARVFHHVLVAG